MDYAQVIAEFLRMIRRRAPILIIVAVLGIAGSVFYALKQPPVFETTAKILIESQQIPTELARSTVNLSAAERLQLIEQELMARDNMTAVIEKLGLFSDVNAPMPMKIDMLRQAITVQSISLPGQSWGNETGVFGFTVTARLDNAKNAAALVNEFVTGAIDRNLQVRANRAGETLAYFEEQEKSVSAAMTAQEAEISDFKSRNADALPESLEFRRDELTRLRESDQDMDQRIFDLGEKRGALQLLLANGDGLGAGGTGPGPEELQLRALELDLAQKSRSLAPTHPEIRGLRAQIAAVTDLMKSGATKSGDPVSGSAAERTATIQSQISDLSSQIETLGRQKAAMSARRGDLEASINRTPEVEIALNALLRKLGELQDQYSVVARGRAEARTGEQLEANQQAERFHVVEPALVPEYAVASNRKKLVVLGSAASIGLAFGLILLLEMLNPVLRNSAQMERQLNLRPVVAIPYVHVAQERGRWRVWMLGPLLIAVVLGASLWVNLPREPVLTAEALADLPQAVVAVPTNP